MNINYLNLMKNTPEIFGSKNRGISEQEFLFLAGGYCNIDISSLDYDKESQNNVKKTLEKANLKIEGREFWVISELDGGEQFDFFHFNDPENPPVYVSHPAYLDEGGDLKRKIANSFSEFIDNIIKKST
ncbi:SMI1/KNR4 family protein [Pontimicrobium sp. MEBiC06410]